VTRGRERARAAVPHLALSIIAAAWLSCCLCAEASAADSAPYPTRPIRLVVASTAGGTADTIARLVGDRLEEMLGQPVVIEDRPGASGNIASEIVARAAPDGYTLLVMPVTVTILPSTLGATAVDPVRAFAPITKLMNQPILIVANPAVGVNTLAELIARARREPGRIAYGTSGVATTPHLAGALLWTRAKVEMLHIPYANAGQDVKDAVAGEVSVALTFLGRTEPLVRSGQLKALAVTSRSRVAAFPDVPTVAESGYPGFEMTSWYGLVAPAGTPRAIIDQLHVAVTRILKSPAVHRKLVAMGTEPAGSSPDEFAAEIRDSLQRWPAIVKAAGIRAE